MGVALSRFLARAPALACVIFAAAPASGAATRVGDFYILVQQVLPEACFFTGSISSTCASPRASWKNESTLQNLRLHGPGHLVYQDCGPAPFKDLPEATRSKLSEFGPEVVEGDWAKAWQQYGACTNLSVTDYFAAALQAHLALAANVSKFLPLPVGQTVHASRILKPYGGPGQAVLNCHEGSNLSAIQTCWSVDSARLPEKRMSCPAALVSSSTCGPKVFVRGFADGDKGQSEFATSAWLVQYTFLLGWFAYSWTLDCRAQGRSSRACCPWTRRTPIQLLAVLHAGTGVFSEEFAILMRTAGETSLAMWPLLSVCELTSNLLISVLMLYWYTFMCSSLGPRRTPCCCSRRACRWAGRSRCCARRPCCCSRQYCCSFAWNTVVLAWAVAYLVVNIQRRSTQDLKEREMDPIPLVSLVYYVINMLLEVCCLKAVLDLQETLAGKEVLRRTLKRVVVINILSVGDSVAMVVVHVPWVREFLSQKSEGWHSGTMGMLFFVRYVTVALLIEPVSACERDGQENISNALLFGNRPSYVVKQGRALVIVNSDYAEESGYDAMDNGPDGGHYEAMLKTLGFRVDRFEDLTAADIERVVKEWVASVWAEGISCLGLALAFAYSGHGELDALVGKDGKQVSIPQLMAWCLGGEASVPKLFFFDCCRGGSGEIHRPSKSKLILELAGCSHRGPSVLQDCIACYATARDFPAYEEGMWARKVCHEIEELAMAEDRDGGYDIEEALKEAGAKVALKQVGFSFGCCGGMNRQCPTYETTLTRRFVLRSGRAARRAAGAATDSAVARRRPSVPATESTVSGLDLRGSSSMSLLTLGEP